MVLQHVGHNYCCCCCCGCNGRWLIEWSYSWFIDICTMTSMNVVADICILHTKYQVPLPHDDMFWKKASSIALPLLDIRGHSWPHGNTLSSPSSIVSPNGIGVMLPVSHNSVINAWIYGERREEEEFSSEQFLLTFSLHIGQIAEKMSRDSIFYGI